MLSEGQEWEGYEIRVATMVDGRETAAEFIVGERSDRAVHCAQSMLPAKMPKKGTGRAIPFLAIAGSLYILECNRTSGRLRIRHRFSRVA